MSKTHWKKVVSDPNYIGEADFAEGQEIVVTIKRIATKEKIKTAEGTSEKSVVYFAEPGIKPMILNVARSQSIEKVSGSKWLEDWPGTKIQLYIDNNVKAFGDIVSAVRVRNYKPRVAAQIPVCAGCGSVIEPFGKMTAAQLAQYTTKKYGQALCSTCAANTKDVSEPTEEAKSESTGTNEEAQEGDANVDENADE
jgi:hypothetical protein